MSEEIIRIDDVHYSYEHHSVLEDINLVLKRGDFLGIVGPNGSGKSTLMKLVLGLLKPHRGSVRVWGQPATEMKHCSLIGYVSQKSNSFDVGFPATVREVIASGLYGKLGLFRRMKPSDWDLVDHAMEQVEISSLAHRNIGRLSGGQQQRVFIARALVCQPKLLILDEPTVGVDSQSTEKFYELLTYLHREQGLSLVLVTHDIGVITMYVNQVACLNKKLFFHGGPQEFMELQPEILSSAYGHEVQIVSHHEHHH